MSPLSDAILSRLEQTVGKEHCETARGSCEWFSSAGVLPQVVVSPETADQVGEILRFAAERNLALVPCGDTGPNRLPWRPARYDVALSTGRMNHIVSYDPDDLTLSVEAGMDTVALQAQLAGHGQFLPLRFGEPIRRSTIGETVAANTSDPLRHAYGTARDFVLGMQFVTGEGTLCKSGGRVVKNVAGYDLHKLMIGSFGTLAVITQVNFRTFPLPRATATFLVEYADARRALDLRRRLAESFLQPRALDILSPAAAELLLYPDPGVAHRFSESAWTVAVAVGGNERVVERHRKDLGKLAESTGASGLTEHTGEEEARLWGWLRNELIGTVREPVQMVLKISTVPSAFGTVLELVERTARQFEVPSATQIRAAGVVYVSLGCGLSDEAARERIVKASNALLAQGGGPASRAILYFCQPEFVPRLAAPPATDDFELMCRLKQVFDPHGVLSPGRFYGGI
jgi:glycolate oxidase FAD binding subunit